MSKKLDGLVAEKLMGWEWREIPAWLIPGSQCCVRGKEILTPHGFEFPEDAPGLNFLDFQMSGYSTDISAAWGVVGKMFHRELSLMLLGDDEGYRADFGKGRFTGPWCHSPAMAICKAALLAHGVQID